MLLFKYGDVLTVTYSKTLILTRMYSIFMQGDRSNKNLSHKKVKFFLTFSNQGQFSWEDGQCGKFG
jgi:hypothetical protein